MMEDWQKHRRGLILVFVFCMAATLSFLSTGHPDHSSAVSTAGFNPGNIISDAVMSNYNSMSAAEIQSFLTSKNSCQNTNEAYYRQLEAQYPNLDWHFENGHFVCLSEERFGDTWTEIGTGQTAAEIIYQAAQDYKINPQVLLVLLEKEQSLITDTFPNSKQYRSATGYGCPDTAACSSKYYGFKNQIRNAAALFRNVLDNGYSVYPERTPGVYVGYNPNAACGRSEVFIENRATAALYRYTPYQPNAAALNAGYGTGDSCSAYGNRNFYLYFHDWFGDLQAKVDGDPVVIPDGEYSLVSKESTGRVLATKRGNVELASLDDANKDQRWYFQRDPSAGSYKITNIATNKVLDLKNNNVSSGTNIQIWDSDDTCGQRWKIYRTKDGYVTIESACASGMVLDYGDTANADANVQLAVSYAGTPQKWGLRVGRTVDDGLYSILSDGQSNPAIDVHAAGVVNNTNIEAFSRHDGLPQRWYVRYDTERDAYSFVNPNSNKYLSLEGATAKNGNNIVLHSPDNSCANYWKILANGGSYSILSTCQYGFVVATSGVANGDNIFLSTVRQSSLERWAFNRLSQPIPDGVYNIVSRKTDSLALDVTAAGIADGTNVEIWDNHGGIPQQWQISYNSTTDDYSILDKNSRKALDLHSGIPAAGKNINIWQPHGECGQRWRLVPTSDNYYTILSSCNSKYGIDLYGGFTKRGTNIQLWDNNTTDNQQWRFAPVR